MDARTEHEQVEALKEWWAKNGKKVTTAAILVLAAITGGRVWYGYQNSIREAASAEYETLINAVRQDNADSALQIGSHIVEEYPQTSYATFAALIMAKMDIQKGDAAAAQTSLRWAMEHAEVEGLDHVARLRLARVLLGENKAGEALDVLKMEQTGTFSGEYAALRGDAYRASGQIAQAETAYSTALNDTSLGAEQHAQIQMKLDSLPSGTVSGETH